MCAIIGKDVLYENQHQDESFLPGKFDYTKEDKQYAFTRHL